MKYHISCLDWYGESRIQIHEFSGDSDALAFFNNLLEKNPSNRGSESFTDWKLERINREEESTVLLLIK